MKRILFFLLIISFISCSDDGGDSPSNKNTIYPGQGVGDITFNSTGLDIIDVYGDPEDITIVNRRFVMWYYDVGIGFLLGDRFEGPGTLQELFDMRFDIIDYNSTTTNIAILPPFPGATTTGLKLGSSKEEIIAAFGEPNDVGTSYDTYDSPVMFIWYNSEEKVRRMDLFKE